ncbi:MAG: hypothetical protein PF486_03110 [Prolixibacteraceae bacterium]|jgi:hypothetical protein|nr:hypothetical protein [Prolixibacteraceae bacterium]
MDINLNLRSQILECSLNIEDAVNTVIILSLGITDENVKTRLFGKKPGITFKNKIDLLFDLQLLSKEDNFNLDLLMVFRNKFMHDINCNSFQNVFGLVDSSIKNKFKAFLNDDETIEDEKSCLYAFQNLYLKNLTVLRSIIETKKNRLQKRMDYFSLLHEQIKFQSHLVENITTDIINLILKPDAIEKDVIQAISDVATICTDYKKKQVESDEVKLFIENNNKFLKDENFQNDLFGIAFSENKNTSDISIESLINQLRHPHKRN